MDKVELHKQFYYHERVQVKEMSSLQLREHIETLQKILFEAKVRVSASMDEERERKAKLSQEQRDGLITTPELDVAVSLRDVKTRKARMSKADKLNELLAGIVDEDTAKSLMKNVRDTSLEKIDNIPSKPSTPKVQTESAMCLDGRHGDCTGRFRTARGSYICKCNCHHSVVKSDSSTEPSKPFNPSSLFGK